MPDTALDTEAIPFRPVLAGDVPVNEPPPPEQGPPPPQQPAQPDVQVAQAPPERNVPAADAPANQPPPRALDPNATPAQQNASQPPTAPDALNIVERPDDEDRRDAAEARQNEGRLFNGQTLEHQEPYRPLVAPDMIDPRTTQKWKDLEALRQHYSEMTPRERKEAESTIRYEQNKLAAETKEKNRVAQSAYIAQQRADMARIDDARATPEQLAKTSESVGQALTDYQREKAALLQSDDPADKRKGDYTMKVSPIGTMKPADFSDAVANFARLNALTPRQAVLYGIVLGSPVNRNEKGELQPGMNTLPANVLGGPDRPVTGMGATNYRVVGKDAHSNVLVMMPDNKIIRVPATTMDQFAAARLKGYGVQKQWWGNYKTERDNAGKDDALTRGAKWLYGKLQ